MKVYVETSVLSAVARREPEYWPALLRLPKLFEERSIQVVTSEVTLKEIERIPDEYKVPHEWLYFFLKKDPFVAEQSLAGFNISIDRTTLICSPRHEEDDIFRKLFRQIGLEHVDAHHLTVAIHNRSDVFLTCDRRTILNKRAQIEEEFSIRVMLPPELVKQLT